MIAQPSTVICSDESQWSLAETIAARVSLPCQLNPDFDSRSAAPAHECVLWVATSGVSIQQTGKKAPGPVRVDFVSGALDHRRRFGGGKGQQIAKAVGIAKRAKLSVLDVTAGLGRDAYVLASLGCRVHMLERNPLVVELLRDGLARAQQLDVDEEIRQVVERMTLDPMSGTEYLCGTDITEFDVVYLDPMFPERSKSASVKKEMALFHDLVGQDADADQLLPLALHAAKYRVVVKRPKQAPFLADQEPTYQLTGKSNRFDIYVNCSIESD